MMQLLVVVAIVIVLAAIAYPVWMNIQKKKNGIVALNKMKQIGGALTQYIAANDGMLPDEESPSGKNDWLDTVKPEAVKAWYNCLPRQLGLQGVADYQKAGNVAGFYSDSSLLYLPGADYPQKRRMGHPMFAYAFNTKLQRKESASDVKKSVAMSRVQRPDRTVAFLEQGLRGEKRPFEFMKRYDGEDCKASARQFVARSEGKGIIVFVDGHAETVSPGDVLEGGEPGGRIKWNPDDSGSVFWTADIKEDPNLPAN
jgi:prepilin-type processing-associated H-X9-DG protein